MFENYSFDPGTVTYNPYRLSPDDMTDIKWLSEDMLQVHYPENYVLDVGWYGRAATLKGVFRIYIVQDGKWEVPLYSEEYRSVSDLYEGIDIAIAKMRALLGRER